MTWTYEKLDENYKRKSLPINDFDGKITGHIVFGVKQWMDENPEERKRLGWIKHIQYNAKEIKEKWPHIAGSQYLIRSEKQVDEYTIEDVYHVVNKSEEMMRLEEMLQTVNGGWMFYDDDTDAVGGVVII